MFSGNFRIYRLDMSLLFSPVGLRRRLYFLPWCRWVKTTTYSSCSRLVRPGTSKAQISANQLHAGPRYPALGHPAMPCGRFCLLQVIFERFADKLQLGEVTRQAQSDFGTLQRWRYLVQRVGRSNHSHGEDDQPYCLGNRWSRYATVR